VLTCDRTLVVVGRSRLPFAGPQTARSAALGAAREPRRQDRYLPLGATFAPSAEFQRSSTAAQHEMA
jgi:hypothetical protein